MSRLEMIIGIRNCRDLYEKLRFEKNKLDSEWNEYDFFNFIVTAWHMQNDWIKNDKTKRLYSAKQKIKQAPSDMKEVVNIARDIANGSKHFKLDKKSEDKKVVKEIHEPEVRSWHSYYFGPKYGISTESSYFSSSDLIYLIWAYFEWIFDDSIKPKSFPDKIEKHLKYGQKK